MLKNGKSIYAWFTIWKVEMNIKQIFIYVSLLSVVISSYGEDEKFNTFHVDKALNLRSEIKSFDITWYFDTLYETGNFINGDWWVIGPVKIIKIDPATQNHRNGSMINPRVRTTHGYDARITQNSKYDSSLNVAIGISKDKPLILPANTSLISTRSSPENSTRPYLESASILTVLDAAPPENSFRPGFTDKDKKVKYTFNSIDFSKLPRKKAVIKNSPKIKSLLKCVERPWIDHAASGYQAQFMHPKNNFPNYGREIALRVSQIGLYLCTDQPGLENLSVGFIQVGIDLYSIATDGGGSKRWIGGGGHNSGRKLPILFAGLMLNDSNMLNLDTITFQEDQQTYYGKGWTGDTALWSPNHVLRPLEDYEHKHPSEWTVDGRGLENDPKAGSNSDFRAESYRICCTGYTWIGIALCAHLLNLKESWNHKPFFDYCVRWVNEDYDSLSVIIKENTGSKTTKRPGILPFVSDMWKEYHW